MLTNQTVALLCASAALSLASTASASDPWADRVIEYNAGTGGSVGYDDPLTALGSPERYTGEGVFPASVTPFNSPWAADEIVSIGEGGWLTVAFDQAVTNDALNPFGLDLLIFGNPFYGATGDPANPVVSGLFAEGGSVEVSANGIDWTLVPGAAADGGFPTLGFTDETNPFGGDPGTLPTDFTKPVNPDFDPTGLTLSELIAGHDGSGGGLGIDIGALGLSQISYVRISSALGSGFTPEIDGFADVSAVPSPTTLAAFTIGGAMIGRRRRGCREHARS
ncbi:MAG: hypothetical protein ACI89L_001495 [Phycisphaerales bacterium]|jgi:hypothetical protein